MTSGIYRLEFKDGSFYIGKSVDIPKRWKQHRKAFEDRTHTKNMQAAHDRCGAPKYIIIKECHPDHIDIMENYFIGLNWDKQGILNSTRPVWYTDSDIEVMAKTPPDLWDISTFEHLKLLFKLSSQVSNLETFISKSEKAKKLKELEATNKAQLSEIINLQAEILRLRSRGLLSRLFNL